jgi:hypothetical protein
MSLMGPTGRDTSSNNQEIPADYKELDTKIDLVVPGSNISEIRKYLGKDFTVIEDLNNTINNTPDGILNAVNSGIQNDFLSTFPNRGKRPVLPALPTALNINITPDLSTGNIDSRVVSDLPTQISQTIKYIQEAEQAVAISRDKSDPHVAEFISEISALKAGITFFIAEILPAAEQNARNTNYFGGSTLNRTAVRNFESDLKALTENLKVIPNIQNYTSSRRRSSESGLGRRNEGSDRYDNGYETNRSSDDTIQRLEHEIQQLKAQLQQGNRAPAYPTQPLPRTEPSNNQDTTPPTARNF